MRGNIEDCPEGLRITDQKLQETKWPEELKSQYIAKKGSCEVIGTTKYLAGFFGMAKSSINSSVSRKRLCKGWLITRYEIR